MSYQLAPPVVQRFWDNNGNPLSGGLVFTYQAGTTTKQATYKDSSGTLNTNPIVLNARGECDLWLDQTKSYKIVSAPSTDTDPPSNPIKTTDNIYGPLSVVGNVIPSNDNTYTLGNSSFAWANIYVGANHAPIFDPTSGNVGYWARTAAEQSAGVTPTNFYYPELADSRRYGAAADAVTDDSAAIQREINVAQKWSTGADLDLGRGAFKINSGLVISSGAVYLRGRGADATRLIFSPSADDQAAISIANGASQVTYGGIRDLSLYSSDTTYRKVALAFQTVSQMQLVGVLVTGVSGHWHGGTGIGSTCLKLNGHELTRVHDCLLYGEQPIIIAPDPNIPSPTLDHFHFSDMILRGTSTKPLVQIQTSGTNKTYTQITFDGFQAWVGGGAGLELVDTTSTGVSNGLFLNNIRTEQTNDATQYFLHIEHNQGFQNIVVRGAYNGDRKGIKLRKCDTVDLQNYYHALANEALNIDSTVTRISGRSCFWQAGSTASISGQTLTYGSPLDPNTGALPPNFIYEPSTNTFGSNIGGPSLVLGGSLSVGASATAPAIGNGGTVTTAGVSVARVAPAAAVTGIIMQPGTVGGQECTVVNEAAYGSGFSLTFAAVGTSNVSGGVAISIAAGTCGIFVWSAGTSGWYPKP